MSDSIKHECGIALLRLKKPLQYYTDKYGTPFYGIRKMYLLMEKQHNRGQDGAGLANIKIDTEPGTRYISRKRSIGQKPIKEIFDGVNKRFKKVLKANPDKAMDAEWLKRNAPFSGELFMGHLRYGTFGKNSIENCHPFLRMNNWKTKNLVVAGNFNLTNVDELFNFMVSIGMHPKEKTDTVTVMEKIGHFLDDENERIYRQHRSEGASYQEISQYIAREMNIQSILENASTDWDGGYVMGGLIGHGDAFVLRDPSGIRPAYFYEDEEVVVVASERPVIQTTFHVPYENVRELRPGHALTIKYSGETDIVQIREPLEKKSCSFERIYFSRGSDQDIYRERMELGKKLVPSILESIDHDMDRTVFSFIPNTAEVSFYGMIKQLEASHNEAKIKEIKKGNLSDEQLRELVHSRTRIHKVAIKDAKLRTFITNDSDRDDLVEHVYDITYGTVIPGVDNLVVIDDSIVRGTTLKQSILRMLDRLKPKKIIVVSSAPQIRYPDCYGIDMAKMGDLIAFKAAIALLKENDMGYIIDEVMSDCEKQIDLPKEEVINHVKRIYNPFTAEEISRKISELLTPEGLNAEVEIIFQSLEGLHASCPEHSGDWYFSGNYPTPGGNKVVNKAFMNYYKGVNERAY
ncbi:MAG: amidophosphoribosyltransferase [Flavobacteriales bacterium]|nr:amidophosphoribosyltransferase [Flavobacteriales bacterium]